MYARTYVRRYPFLSSLNSSIFYSQHGESMLNVKGKIGGNSDLSERGQRVCVHTYGHTYMHLPMCALK